MSRAQVYAAVVVVIVVVAAVGAWLVFDSDDSRDGVVRGDLTVSSGLNHSYIELDEYAGVATLEYTGEGDAVWMTMNDDDPCYVTEDGETYTERECEVASTGSVLRISEPGCYTVELLVDGDVKCTGTAVLDGTVERIYSWSETTRGHTYSYEVVFTYRYSDYYAYASDEKAERWEVDGQDPTRFAVVDDALTTLAYLLEDEYEAVRGTPTAQAYADYLLGFVQCCIEYPTELKEEDGVMIRSSDGLGDLYLYGADEYWAYPMETLHHGLGDCEDTCLLAAALFTASGYTAGVAIVPGHMVALVVLEEFSPHTLPYSNTTLSMATLDGGVAFFCESTFDNAVPCGYVTIDVDFYLKQLDYVWLVDR